METGACHCGKITFKVKGPATWAGRCHCRQCQTLHGAAFATWVGYQTSEFQIDDPENVMKTFNSGIADRGFCGHCGSSFYFKYVDETSEHAKPWLDWVYFAAACMKDQAGIQPTQHIYWDSKAPWIAVHDELEKCGLDSKENLA